MEIRNLTYFYACYNPKLLLRLITIQPSIRAIIREMTLLHRHNRRRNSCFDHAAVGNDDG